MRRLTASALVVLACGCADIRTGLQASADHVAAISRAVSSPESSTEDLRETVGFHASRALRWSDAMLEHKGAPPAPVDIPVGPADASACGQEDMELARYRADVERERRWRGVVAGFVARHAGGGLWGQLAAWLGGGGLASVGALLAKRKIGTALEERRRSREADHAAASDAMAALDELKTRHPNLVKQACAPERRPALRRAYLAREANGDGATHGPA